MVFNKAKVEMAKQQYPIGTRVELYSLCNDERDMPTGLRGTVVGVDDQPALLMNWENGRTLSLLVGEDSFRKLTTEELYAELNIDPNNIYEKHLETFMSRLNQDVLKDINFAKLDESYKSEDKTYAKNILRQMHDTFTAVYGKESIGYDVPWVYAPAVIVSEKQGTILGLVQLDPTSSGEHWGTTFITPLGIVSDNDEEMGLKQLEYCNSIVPYDYYYTINMDCDHHVDWDNCPQEIKEMIKSINPDSEQNSFEISDLIDKGMEMQ
jgi:hypothetical protein